MRVIRQPPRLSACRRPRRPWPLTCPGRPGRRAVALPSQTAASDRTGGSGGAVARLGDGATDAGLRSRNPCAVLPSFYNPGMRRGILERDAELSVLAHAVRGAADRHGSVVLVMGEAGIGKSSLVEALRFHLPAKGRMLVGYCDDLATPRTLGPFRDLAGSVGTEFSRAVADGSDRDRVLTALRTELTWPEHPTVLVIEDVHWADDATLDALRYLIRRIADLPAVLVLTYRDDELNREHPLHGLLGQASRSDHVRHLPLHRLSQQAVRQLSAGSPVDAHDLFELTSGNPFFVHE